MDHSSYSLARQSIIMIYTCICSNTVYFNGGEKSLTIKYTSLEWQNCTAFTNKKLIRNKRRKRKAIERERANKRGRERERKNRERVGGAKEGKSYVRKKREREREC